MCNMYKQWVPADIIDGSISRDEQDRVITHSLFSLKYRKLLENKEQSEVIGVVVAAVVLYLYCLTNQSI